MTFSGPLSIAPRPLEVLMMLGYEPKTLAISFYI